MSTRLFSLIRKEFIQTMRDVPVVMLVLYIFAEIVLCGWSLTMDIKHIPTAVLDRDQTQTSRELVSRFSHAENFRVDYYPQDEAELDRIMDSGKITLGLIIPAGLGQDIVAGKPVEFQAIVDGTQPNASLITLGYVQRIAGQYSANILVERLERSELAATSGGLPSVTNRLRAWYVPGMTYIHFSMVSMITLAVVMLGILLTAASIVREKEAGTLEQLMVTPIRPIELILAKVLPMVVLELGGLAIGLALSYLIFGVAPHGVPAVTLALFFALSTLAFLVSAGIGIWIATMVKSLQQALMLSFFILFPVLFLSGSLTPVSAMPVWLQWISFFSPMRHYLSLALSLFLKGVGMKVVWPHVGLLAAFTFLIVLVAMMRFRRSLT